MHSQDTQHLIFLMRFLNIYNCTYKIMFCKSGHIYVTICAITGLVCTINVLNSHYYTVHPVPILDKYFLGAAFNTV